MINWSIGFLPIALIVLAISWFLTKSWIKVGYIFEILFGVMSLIITLGLNTLDYYTLKPVLILLSLGLLINGAIGLLIKHK
jgi:hypothetical protein